MNKCTYTQACKLANRINAQKRAAVTENAKKFMDTLHGTHMAPGKFK